MKALELDSPKIGIIYQSEVANWLTQVETQRFLAPFMSREKTISEAAKELGISPNSLLYRVNQMLSFGLIEVIREKKRPGKAIKIYRTTADIFFIPFALTSAETLEALFMPMGTYWQSLFVRNASKALNEKLPHLGIQIWRGETDELYAKPASEPGNLLDFSEDEDMSLVAFWSAALYLDEDDAKQYQQALLEVYQRYASKKGKQRYMTHLALTPWLLEDTPV